MFTVVVRSPRGEIPRVHTHARIHTDPCTHLHALAHLGNPWQEWVKGPREGAWVVGQGKSEDRDHAQPRVEREDPGGGRRVRTEQTCGRLRKVGPRGPGRQRRTRK